MAERLNHQLIQCRGEQIRLVDSAAFSIAMSGTEARLYVSWQHDELKSYMRKVDNVLLQNPDHYLKFPRCVLNVIDWGKDVRLEDIRDSLDILLEESRKSASETATSRRPPLHGSVTSTGKRPKYSTTRRNSSIYNSDATCEDLGQESARPGYLHPEDDQQD